MSQNAEALRAKQEMLSKLQAMKKEAAELMGGPQQEEEVMLSEEQIDELREAFALFDRSGDGQINVKEMQVIMRSIGQNPSEEEIIQIMTEVDPRAAESKQTDFEGFLKLMRKKLNNEGGGEMDEEMFEAFKTYDRQGRGYYDLVEMKEVMAEYGEKLGDQEALELFKLIDQNGDGRITFDEFVLMMMAK